MEQKWYQIILNNWSQIVVVLGSIGFVIRTLTIYWLKRREITFSRIQENKILEIKVFYKSYQSLEIALMTYLNQISFGEHSNEIFRKNREDIYSKFIDFSYNSMTVKLFLDTEDIITIDEITKTFECIRIDLETWLIYSKSTNPPDGWDKLEEIRKERFPKKLPELIKKIETSLRQSFELK